MMKAKRDWSKVLPKNFHNLGLILGSKFHKNVGVEVGYERSNKKSTDASFTAADTFFGTQNPLRATFTTKAKVRLSSFHFDVMGYMPIGCDDFNLIGTVGLASTKPKIDITSSVAGNNDFESVSGKRKVIPRIGFGAQYQEEGSMFGVRGLVRWEGTSRLKADLGTLTNRFPDASSKIYKSAISVAVAGIVSF
eukprot:TRINITY_DN6827_c0_g3_i4.p1 TRINITY_DN6827_c0_g3~~TRINITY_DN6827_c0_g3_i4.p1  ORF type:complete len:193 (-),score=10.69 TRINITY_DN6827_c0_g3_i4:183-761(-)